MNDQTHLSLRKKLLFSLLLLFFFFGLPEAILRWRGLNSKDTKPEHVIFNPDVNVKWQLAPNLKDAPYKINLWNPPSIYFTPITTNSEGFREDHEITLERPENELRIAVVGDSVTMGFGLKEEDCFVEILEKKIQGFLDQTEGLCFKKVEVINCGVTGYTSDQEYYVTVNKVIPHYPNLVIHQVCANDVKEFSTQDGMSQLWMPDSFASQAINTMGRYSYLVRAYEERINEIRKRVYSSWLKRENKKEDSNFDENYPVYFEFLLREFESVQATAADYLLLILPHRGEIISGMSDNYVFKVIEFAQQNDIPYYEMKEDFLRFIAENDIDPKGLSLHTGDDMIDSHYNALGSEIVAELLFRFIQEKKLI